MRQHRVVVRRAQGKGEPASQAFMQGMAAEMAFHLATGDSFAFGDLYPLLATAGDTARQQRLLEHTGACHHLGELLPVGGLVHMP